MSQDTIESLRARVAELESSPTMAAVRITVESKVAEENTRLYQRIAELEEQLETEQARGIHSCHPGCLRDGCVNRRLRDQLAAQALRIKTMRAVLENFIDSHEECTDLDGFTAQIVSMDDYHEAQEPLSLPDNSTEILQEWLAKQLGEPVGCEWQPIETAPITCNSLLIRRNGEICIANWGDYDEVNQPKFTHWMPLPHPPEIK